MPVWERGVRRRPTLEHLAFLRQTQWRTPEEIARLQLGELRALLAHCGRNVPYYRELFAKVGFDPRGITSARDLEALPLLTRETIRERYDDLVDPARRGRNLRKGTTGSTGTPLRFEYSRESEVWRQAVRIRAYGWSGYEPGAPTYYYWGRASDLPRGADGARIRLDRAMRRELFVDSMAQDEASCRSAIDLFRRQRPRTLVGYTQSTADLARYVLDRGLRDWDDVPVVCGAEAVFPADRAALERAFGPVFETYGARETMLLAAECEAHDGMHLAEENLVVEIVQGGKVVPHGEVGDVVVTDLHNYGMPLVRYVNGDLAAMHVEGRCRCGRGLARLAHVDGRRVETLRARDGTPIPGIVFAVLFAGPREEIVRHFQATQRASGAVELRIIRGRHWSDAGFADLEQRVRGYLRGQPLTVEVCETIPLEASGKRRSVIVEPP
jgi:phenylacetate-CoA ligase